jgi:predicted short-subunit dehydrogenase-like oxidoreductase (DUF2520 family)
MKYGISIIGAGRVGRALGRGLHEKGWRIHSVVNRTESSARRAVRSIGAGHSRVSLTTAVLAPSVILIAVPESSIDAVVANLAAIGAPGLRGKVVLYTSGALSSAVLAPLRQLGAAVGTIHPLQTFSGVGMPELDGRVFVVEGDRAALLISRRIVRNLGGQIVQFAPTGKILYHAAAIFACGHVLALTEAAIQIFASLGMKRREALKALLPLTRQVLENLERVGPRAAWTGPLARGDFRVIERHQAALRALPVEYLQAYRAVNRLAARVLASDPETVLGALDEISAAEEFQSTITEVRA